VYIYAHNGQKRLLIKNLLHAILNLLGAILFHREIRSMWNVMAKGVAYWNWLFTKRCDKAIL